MFNASVVKADLQLCGVEVSIKLVSENVFLTHLWRVSIEAL